MHQLIQHIEQYIKLEEFEKNSIYNLVNKSSFKRNETFFTEGKISREIYFVAKGCVRLYYLNEGNDKTAFFYTEGQFICAGESFTYSVPAKENYQAIEDSELYILSKDHIDRLMEISPRLEVLARIATENELIVCQNIIASFVTKSAEERYLELLEKNGELFHRVPQQYIASFLGVSPETLSRIKRRVLKKRGS